MSLDSAPPRDELAGLYIHVPFCRSVCPYCDYAVLIGGEERRRGFVDALCAEVELDRHQGWRFDTVYLGGGTPSSLDPGQLERILAAVRSGLTLTDDVRVFIEANPEDVSQAAVRAWRELGIQTVSLGVQSFSDRVLADLGRRHTAERARRAVELLLAAGFGSLSLDLIYGLEGQGADEWRQDLEQAIACGPDHLSCYQLTVHDGTVFGKRVARGELSELDRDRQGELFRLTHRKLAEAGFEGYEVSNFAAAPAHRSRHNRKYWEHVPYLGLGPSAHSFRGNRRWWNERKLRRWQRDVEVGRRPLAGEETLTPVELALEAVMLGLRTAKGIDVEGVRARFGVDLEGPNEALIARCLEDGLLRWQGPRLVPTLDGLAVADGLARQFEILPLE